jgi:hypothetical protein
MIAQFAVMRDVAVGHDQIVIAEDRDADIGQRRTMNRDKFPDGVKVPDHHTRFFAAEFQILRRGADGAELKNTAALADLCVVIDDGMGSDHGVFADFDVIADNAVRPDFHAVAQLDVRRNNGCGMNFHFKSHLFYLFLLQAVPLV